MDDFYMKMAYQFEVLDEIWKEAGCGMCEKRKTMSQSIVLSKMQELVDAERNMLLQMRNAAETLERQLHNACETLNVEFPVVDPTLSLGSRINFYKKTLDKHQNRLKEIQEKFDEIWTDYCQKCHILGENPVDKPDLLNDKIISNFEAKLDGFRRLELERKRKVDELLDSISKINEIIIEPAVFNVNMEKLDNATIGGLEKIHNDLKVHLQNQELESENLRNQISCLWKRLPDANDMNKWLTIHSGYDKSVLESLKNKLSCLERERMKNLPKFIESLKSELKELWMKCCLSEREQQKHQFSAEINEDTVTSIEKLIQHFKSYYEEARPLLELYSKWNSSREELETLERNAKDPSRLNNRGGRLLKEERRKNHLVKIIPELEKKLVDEARLWKMSTGRDFVVFDKTIAELFHEDQIRKRVLKDSEKRNRTLKSSQNLTVKSPKKFDRTFKRFKSDTKFETVLDSQETVIYPESSDTLSTISSLTDFAEGIEERNRDRQTRSSSKYKRRRSKSAEPMHYSKKSPGINKTRTRLSPHHKCMSRVLKSPKLETKFTPFKPFLI